MCAMVKIRYIGDGHPTFSRNPYNGYINPYYWVDDHPLLYGNNGSLDPGTCYRNKEFHFYSTLECGYMLRGWSEPQVYHKRMARYIVIYNIYMY